MGNDNAFDARFLRRFDDRQHFGRPDMAGRQNHVVLGDDLEALAGGFGDFAVLGHVEEGAGDAQGAHLAGDAHPVGQLGFVALASDRFQLVGVVD